MLFSGFDVQARKVFKLFCGFCLVALLFLSG